MQLKRAFLIVALFIFASVIQSCALRNGRSSSQMNDAASSARSLEGILSRIALTNLQGKSFELSQPVDSEMDVKAQLARKILGKTVRQPVSATLFQTYDIKLHMPASSEGVSFKVNELARFNPRHYQLTATLQIKGIQFEGKYHAKLKQDSLGNPSIIDTSLTGTMDVTLVSTTAWQWDTNDNGAVVFHFVPLARIILGPNGERISATLTTEMERFEASVDRVELEASTLNRAVDALHNAASETDAENLRNAVNKLCKDAANQAIQHNKADMDSTIIKSLSDANASDKVAIEDFMSKLAVRVILN